MTWTVLGSQSGAVHVGSDGQTNPYSGDTTLDQSLPLLCVNVNGQAPPQGIAFDYYNGWLRGSVGITAPVQGLSLGSKATTDAVCSDTFGAGWRVAEFHDGRHGADFSQQGGWTFWGYGSIASGTRFWASINDQPANPWNAVAPDLAQAKSILEQMVSPLLGYANNPAFRDVVRNGVAQQFDGDDNVLLSDVIAQAEVNGAVDPWSPEWQSFKSQVDAFANINGSTYYPQIYIPNYGSWFPDGNITVVTIEYDADVETAAAYQIDAWGNINYIGHVDENYAASNEVWVLSINERVAMEPEAYAMVRQLDAIGATSPKRGKFSMQTNALNCNPTGLRNDNGMEYLRSYRIPNLKGVEHWTAGKVEPRVIIIAKGGFEVGNKKFGKIKRNDVKNGQWPEIYLTTWNRANLGDYFYYKWIEEDFGPEVTVSLGLTAQLKTKLNIGANVNVSAKFANGHDDMGGQLVHFFESTNIEYSTGTVYFTVCTIGGDGHTGDNNLARAALVSASSTYSGYSPQRVNDGDRSTNLGGAYSWCNTGYGSGYPPQWLQLDFGTNKTFSRVDLYTTTGYVLRDYDIEIFNPITGWQWVASVTGNTLTQRTTTFGSVTARLMRIRTLSGPTHQPGFTRINELEVYP